jgi:hypothetical protein
LNSEFSQPGQEFNRNVNILGEYGFGYLEFQTARRQFRFFQRMRNVFDKVWLIKLLDREIDANKQWSVSLVKVLPGFCLPARSLQNALTDLQYLSTLLSHRNKILWWNQAKLGMTPTYEHFKADKQSGLERNNRLIIYKQLIALTCMPQIRFHF